MLSYEEARQKVIEQISEKKGPRATEQVRVEMRWGTCWRKR